MARTKMTGKVGTGGIPLAQSLVNALAAIEEKPRKHKPGVKALMEAKKLQKDAKKNVLPMRATARLCKRYLDTAVKDMHMDKKMISRTAIDAFRDVLEYYTISVLDRALMLCTYAKRSTLTQGDLDVVMFMSAPDSTKKLEVISGKVVKADL